MRATAVAVFALIIFTGLSAAKGAPPGGVPPGQAKKDPPGGATSGSWQTLASPPCVNGQCINADSPLLLTDGTVMVHETCGTRWFRLTPDTSGSYVNGTWSELASTPGYAPRFYASAVLPDGRVIIEGGEDNCLSPADPGPEVETNLGRIYDARPVAISNTTNTWTPVAPPSGWATIGDAASVVLFDGRFMLGNCCNSKEAALLNALSLSWTITGSNKADLNHEEGWTLLPDGTVLTIDVNNTGDPTHSERYLPSSGSWISAGSTGVQLAKLDVHEIGPALLLPDGTVFAVGATGNTAIYKPPGNINQTGSWVPGPTFPQIGGQQFASGDGPAALLPDGNVLVAASPLFTEPGAGPPPTHFFEFDGGSLTQVADPQNPPANTLSENTLPGRLLMLPTGQALFTEWSNTIWVYNPAGTFKEPWRPTIEHGPFTLVRGGTYPIDGRLFNGRSGGSSFGDNYQGPTNYPLVRLTSAEGEVFYCFTYNPSTSGVAVNGRVSTNFLVPSNIAPGDYQLEVVTNGIPSRPKAASVM